MRRSAALLLAVGALVAGCGHPLIPASALKPAPPSASSTPAFPSTPATTAPPLAVSASTRVLGARPAKPILGVDLFALSNYPAAEVQFYGERMMSYIKDVLKADAVGIVWKFFAPTRHDNSVLATRDTLSSHNVAILTKIARQHHLLVMYRPLIFVSNQRKNPWEGLIRPHDPVKWFASYYRVELPYLKVAQRLHVREFVTATEMHYLNTSPLWVPFLARVARVYHGVTSYSAWDMDYLNTPLLPVKYVGMDMYHHLSLPAGASAAQVTAAWEDWFHQIPAADLQRTMIDETGIQARAGAYHRPQDLSAPGHLAEQVQANWYTAACNTVRAYHMRGVFFWKTDLTDNPAHPATSLSTFEGRQGALAISECARILR